MNRYNSVLGFDFGTSRIGVAAGQSITGTASELPPIAARDGVPDWSLLNSIIDEWKPDALVVGIPLNMDGSISEMARRARKFANRMSERYQRPVFLCDERLSSAEAKEIHHRRGGSHNYKKESVDGLAACLILESWFNSGTLMDSQTPLEKLYALGT